MNKGKPGNPAQIEKYWPASSGIGWRMPASDAELAAAHEPADLYRRGFRLYEQFRPGVPAGRVKIGARPRAPPPHGGPYPEFYSPGGTPGRNCSYSRNPRR